MVLDVKGYFDGGVCFRVVHYAMIFLYLNDDYLSTPDHSVCSCVWPYPRFVLQTALIVLGAFWDTCCWSIPYLSALHCVCCILVLDGMYGIDLCVHMATMRA